MRGVFASSVALSALALAAAQTTPPTGGDGTVVDGDTTWKLYDGGGGIKYELTSVVNANEPAASRTATWSFSIFGESSNRINMIRGVSLALGATTMWCPDQDDTSDQCLVYPIRGEAANYPRNGIPYFSTGFRKLLLSFNNPDTVSDVEFCKASMLTEFCENREGCESFNSNKDYTTEYTNAINSGGKNPTKSLSITNVVKSRTTAGRNRKYTLSFDIENVPNDLFGDGGKGGTDPDWTLGFNNGHPVVLSFGLWWDATQSSACTDQYHRESFTREPDEKTLMPQTADRQDAFQGVFTTVIAPTPAPTTPIPTKKPTTGAPTKKPTTGSPTDAPTMKPTPPPTPKPTGKPTKAPTAQPTKKPTTASPTRKPTTGVPSKSPTQKPTQRPTTAKPTRAPRATPTKRPTTPKPTRNPIDLPCPQKFNWNWCQNINTWYKGTKDPARRQRQIASACSKNDCFWCGYDDLVPGAYNCRPKTAGEKGTPEGQLQMTINEVCTPGTSEMPFTKNGKCELFSDCPEPEHMTACKALNFEGPGYKKNRCEGGFSTTYQGVTYRAPNHVCAYANGICRAVGKYFWAKKTLTQISGYFDKIKRCPYSTDLPDIPQNN